MVDRFGDTECSSACMRHLEGGHRYLHYLHHSLVSGQKTGRAYRLTNQLKIGLKIYWAWTCPWEQTQFPPLSVSPFRKLPWASFPYPSEGRQNETHKKLSKLTTWTTALSNSMKLWAMPCKAIQDRQVIVESSGKTWSTREENGKPLQYSCLENPVNIMKSQKDRTLKDELARLVGNQYVTGDQWRNNSRKNEEMEPKQKQHPIMDVTGDGSKVWYCKEQYYIGTWNVRPMNQDKLEVVKQKMARVTVDTLGISELKWMGILMEEFNLDDHYI